MTRQQCACGRRINYRSDRKTFDQCFKCRSKPAMVVCAECGHSRRRRDVEDGQKCRNCVRIRNAADAELREAARIDWVAVERVIAGGSASLNRDEQMIAVRALSTRIVAANSDWLPPGMTSTAKLGRRMGGVTADGVRRMVARLPEATRHVCPRCRGFMWVLNSSGVVEQHGNGVDRCPMSGNVFRPWSACPVCREPVAETCDGNVHKHRDRGDNWCPASGEPYRICDAAVSA